MTFLASIPSPSSGTLDLGPLTVHMYGLTLLAAIALATYAAGKRWVNRGGDWDLIFRCAVWGSPQGSSARASTTWRRAGARCPRSGGDRSRSGAEGSGLGRDRCGCLVGGIVAKRAGADVWLLADCLAPGLLLAQGLGRLGNWWNQELFGKPTDLPWGLEIDPINRPLEYIDEPTFHPTFLYELIWDFGAAAILVFLIERRLRPRPPGVFAAYIALYCFGRFWMELLRVDPAHELAGLRINAWMSLIGIVAGAAWYVLSQRSDRPAGLAPGLRPRCAR